MSWQTVIFDFLSYGILLYSVVLISFYVFIGLYSIGETRRYLHKNSFVDYRVLATSPEAPSISIIAPAYNEGATIIDNVRSLLSINYSRLEVIIVNDGSRDDSLPKLIGAYELERIDYFINQHIPTKPVKAVYRSRNPVFRKLMVVDKENGGKADALNVGVNISTNTYFICIDVDCILEQDALLRMAKPFLESNTARVIATGGVIRIANSCVVEDGRLVKVNLPSGMLPRMQTLEYIRAFLLGRMAWSRLNGLLLISGAFGAFDREIVIRCGGYSTRTVGEDMELVVRMRRYMEERKLPYKVTYIPDPLCWTEAPSTFKILGRQRNRWARGTFETLLTHRKLFFNPRYKLLGMVSYPYWLFFEYMAPIIEFLGLLAFLVFLITGEIHWPFFMLLIGAVLLFGWLYSTFAVLMEAMTYNQYKRRRDMFRLLFAAIAEPFIFHPAIILSSLKGNWYLVRKKTAWGEMTRKGFGNKTEKKA